MTTLDELIRLAYEHLDSDHLEQAVMACVRITRQRKDFLFTAVFLREMRLPNDDLIRAIYDDTNHLKEETGRYIYEHSHKVWLETRTLPYALGQDERGNDFNLLIHAVSEIDQVIAQYQQEITELTVPSGMSEFDTAAFFDECTKKKEYLRRHIRALLTIRANIKSRCFRYLSQLEAQIKVQKNTESFLSKIQTDVHNYCRSHSEDLYAKLIKAAELIDSEDAESLSLLLTQVRRAIQAAADHFYPSRSGTIKCADGKERVLGDEQYLNRLHEYLATAFPKSSSRDLLRAEFEHLSIFAKRLNDVASKGVHASVSDSEAKQGLLGLYLFLYNVISRQDNPVT
ncbi:MAG: hypothetical protein ACTFAK_01640 [Candidatus Electronema sp. VV]